MAPLASVERDPTAAAITHALAILPFVTIAALIYVALGLHVLAGDFAHSYLPATHALLAGHNPYSLQPVDSPTAFIYPPVAAYIWAPFAVFPTGVATGLATALMVLAILGTLALLGVRDWRCYSIALLWFPAVFGIQTANVSVLLVLGAAALWRYRDRPFVAGVVTGLLVALKLYVWPLGVFLLFTGRLRASAFAAMSAGLFVFFPWSWNGFAGLAGYPHRLLAFEAAKRGNSYTLGALLAPRLGWKVAHAAVLLAGIALVVLLWRWREDDVMAMVVTLAAVLALSSIVREEYFLVLLIVLAITRIPLGWPWIVPLAYWGTWQSGQMALWRIAATLAITALGFASPYIAQRLRKRSEPGAATPGSRTSGFSQMPPVLVEDSVT